MQPINGRRMSTNERKVTYAGKPVIESPFVPASGKQENYIQILATDLGLKGTERDVHISEIIGKKFTWINDKLSKEAASRVIEKFKEWRELRSRNE